jgi:hypothetical protein
MKGHGRLAHVLHAAAIGDDSGATVGGRIEVRARAKRPSRSGDDQHPLIG